jgi:lysyl-tRNA synthetase class I
MEPLQEGQPTFYTFFLASLQPSEDGGRKAYSPLRFRLTVSTKDENEEIESLLKRFEERSKLDPARENMARALKRIGLAIEYEDGLDNMEKTLLQQVKDKKLPPEEEERKIRVVQEIIRQERSHEL